MWKEKWESYIGRLIGIGAGLFFGLLYLFVGLWDTFICMVLVAIGYDIGKKRDLQLASIQWRQVVFRILDRWKRWK